MSSSYITWKHCCSRDKAKIFSIVAGLYYTGIYPENTRFGLLFLPLNSNVFTFALGRF